MRSLVLCFAVAGCGSSPTMMLPKRDAGLQLEELDLGQWSVPADLSGRDLSGRDSSTGGDMASGGTCAAALAAVKYDFESGPSGFEHQASDGHDNAEGWPYDEWDIGTPSGSGPGACHGGSRCWGTYLPGNYANCERGELWSPIMNLSACAASNLKLVFWHWYDFWSDTSGSVDWYDGGVVEISGDDGGTWNIAAGMPGDVNILPTQGFPYECDGPAFYVNGSPGYTESSGGWMKVEVPIPASLRTSRFRVRFLYATGVNYPTFSVSGSRTTAAPGWYIDDLSVELQ